MVCGGSGGGSAVGGSNVSVLVAGVGVRLDQVLVVRYEMGECVD